MGRHAADEEMEAITSGVTDAQLKEHDVEVSFDNEEQIILACRCGWEFGYPSSSVNVRKLYRKAMNHFRATR